MSQKRQSEDKGEESDKTSTEEKRPRVPSLRSVIAEVMRTNAIQNIFSSLEPLIRRVVKEEVEVALRNHLSDMKQNCENQVHPSTSRSLQLQFINKLSLPVFTGTRIEGEEYSAIKVSLVDALTGQVVNSGPESQAKVEIVVLEGDFEGYEEENWTSEEFNNNIVKEREGKRPLLVGNSFLELNEGIGDVGDLIFTDNSSWTRSRKFKLGARAVGSNFGQIRVREAKTEPFVVKDHRGELYKKHYPPSLLDEVWRLEKIGKDGAFHKRLNEENIKTVMDFLTSLNVDSSRLRNILGQGMTPKIWEVTVDHARTCQLNNQMYVYHSPSDQTRTGVVFNVVGQVVGLVGEQHFIPFNELPQTKKDDSLKLVKVAYEHWDDVVVFKDGSILSDSLHLPAICFPSGSSEVENAYSINSPTFLESTEFSFTQPNPSSPDFPSSILSIEDVQNYTFQDNNSLIYASDTISKTTDSEDYLEFFNPEATIQSENFSLDSQADLRSVVNGFLATGSAATVTVDKAKTRWTILYSVLRLIFSIKRIVASKRSGMLEMDKGGKGLELYMM